MNINSADYYTERLIPFLKRFIENKTESLLELVNLDWKLSYLFLARQIIGSISMEQDEDSKYNFEEKLEKLAKILNLDFSHSNEQIEQLNIEIKKRILAL